MNAQPRFFAPLARLLHWLMALMIIAMLFIGTGLASGAASCCTACYCRWGLVCFTPA